MCIPNNIEANFQLKVVVVGEFACVTRVLRGNYTRATERQAACFCSFAPGLIGQLLKQLDDVLRPYSVAGRCR